MHGKAPFKTLENSIENAIENTVEITLVINMVNYIFVLNCIVVKAKSVIKDDKTIQIIV